MYLGSVRFFKHLILGIVALAIIIPTVLSVSFFIKNKHLLEDMSRHTLQNTPVKLSTALEVYNNSGSDSALPQYSGLYPDLKVPWKYSADTGKEKVAYLTFDDGPSHVTQSILDTLKKNNVEATFFVVGSQLDYDSNQRRLKRIAKEGHTIGIHTETHKYEEIYSSVEAYLKDFNTVWTKVKEITGKKAEIFRFPGGSLNGYNQDVQHQLVAEMLRRGFKYYDWNISSMDAADQSYSADRIVKYSTDVGEESSIIILMHDSEGKINTAQALPTIISKLKKMGYSFKSLDSSVKPIIFGYQE